MGNDLLEFGEIFVKIIKYLFASYRACCCGVLFDKRSEPVDILLLGELGEAYESLVELGVEVKFLIEDICDTAAHTCRKVLAGLSEDNCAAACHIFAAVVAHTLYNYRCA